MRSFMKWMGGQSLLAGTIAGLLPRHRCYVEVFGGAAWVLFAKSPSAVEVYNDMDSRLVELFRCVKEHPQEFVRQVEYLLPSREMFELFRAQPGLTEIQRAARFFFVLKLSFGGRARNFGYSKADGARFLIEKIQVDIERVRKRLQRVLIERGDFEDTLRRYDGPDTLFHLAPPYINTAAYEIKFGAEDHERLRLAIDGLTGKWLLVYNEHEWVKEAYRGYQIHRVMTRYTLPNGRPAHAPQLLITNYRITKAQLRSSPKPLIPLMKRRRLRKHSTSRGERRSVKAKSSRKKAPSRKASNRCP